MKYKIFFLSVFFLIFLLLITTQEISTASNDFIDLLKEVDKNIKINKNLQKYNIDDKIIIALIKKESNFDKFAVSHKCAYGYMQILLPTAKMIETDTNVNNIFELKRNIRIGIKHLDNLCKTGKSQKDVLQKYYWGNKKQLHKYYYWDIIRLSKKIKKAGRT